MTSRRYRQQLPSNTLSSELKSQPSRLSGRRFFAAPSFQVRPKQAERVWRLLRPQPLAILQVAAFPRSSDRITLITPQNTRRRK